MNTKLRDRLLAAYVRTGWRGFDRTLRLCGHRPGDRIRARTRYGSWFDLDPWSYLERIALREGYYESEVLLSIVDDMKPGDVFWDIGANVGIHAVTAKLMAPEAQVVCFEPSPAVIGLLWNHIALNAVDIQVAVVALSVNAGFHVLHVATAGNTGMSSLVARSDDNYMGRAVVRTVAGDDFIAAGHAPAPTIIKLDVEGHELNVLRGLKFALASPSCRRVVFEDEPGATPTKEFLRATGFKIDRLTRNEHSETRTENFVAERVRA